MIERNNVPPSHFVPFNEVERIRALMSTCLLDSAADPAFDLITRVAAEAFRTPIATVSLIDQHRQWFKSAVGVTCTETPREDSFCTHAILQRTPLIVLDARLDRRFRDMPSVKAPGGVRFYLGVPIRSEDGMPIGALCVADCTPRTRVSPKSVALLQSMAANVEKLVRAHRIAGYVDARSGLPNQRRFRENMEALALRTALAETSDPLEMPSHGWALSVEAASDVQVRAWIAAEEEGALDDRLKDAARWIAATTPLVDGVYRLSPRHLSFFVMARSKSHILSLIAVLQRGLDRIIPKAAGESAIHEPSDEAPDDAQRWQVRAVLVPADPSELPLLDVLLAPATRVKTQLLSRSRPRQTAEVVWQPRLTIGSYECVGFDVDLGAFGADWETREAVVARFGSWAQLPGHASSTMRLTMQKEMFFGEDIADWLRCVARSGLRPEQIAWAIPARLVRNALDRVKARCEQLRHHGIGLVVRDFGAEYDSLGWLPSLPLAALCLDAQVINVVTDKPQHAATVRRIVSLAHALSIRVCAPELDDSARLATARMLGCDEGTGNALAAALDDAAMLSDPIDALARTAASAASASPHQPFLQNGERSEPPAFQVI